MQPLARSRAVGLLLDVVARMANATKLKAGRRQTTRLHSTNSVRIFMLHRGEGCVRRSRHPLRCVNLGARLVNAFTSAILR